jgi:hypothetical protein
MMMMMMMMMIKIITLLISAHTYTDFKKYVRVTTVRGIFLWPIKVIPSPPYC